MSSDHGALATPMRSPITTLRLLDMSRYQLTCGWGQVVKFYRMKRSDFSSADTYIIAYQTQYNQLGLHKVETDPFGAMFVMLYDLEGELASVKFTYQAIEETIPDTVTKDIFSSMCNKLIVKTCDVTYLHPHLPRMPQ